MHIIRAVVGTFVLLLSLVCLADAMPNRYPPGVYRSLEDGRIGPALETLLRHTHEGEAILAAVLFIVSVVILAWPARRLPGYFSAGSAYPVHQQQEFGGQRETPTPPPSPGKGG